MQFIDKTYMQSCFFFTATSHVIGIYVTSSAMKAIFNMHDILSSPQPNVI